MKRVLHITVQYMFWEAEEAAEGFQGFWRQEVTPPHMLAGGGRIHIWWNRERPNELLDNSSLILTVVCSWDVILYRLLMGIFLCSSIFHFLSAHQMAGDLNNDTLSVLNSLLLWLHSQRLHAQFRPRTNKAEMHTHTRAHPAHELGGSGHRGTRLEENRLIHGEQWTENQKRL